MKQNTIKLFATQIPYTDEVLEENEVYVEFDVEELLDQIDNEDIANYARFSLDMIPEDSVYSSLDDFDEDDIVSHLEDGGYNFSKHIGEEDCIEFLEESGYTVLTDSEVDNGLDIIDSRMLEEIEDIFINSSVFEREKIYNLIKTWI
ncbi:MAG TPA: hypothetical protein VLA48_03525 [Nitrososphaeraceae archaeon]|nr:hypothetical protein [Nitrososphaeraceae archaeon]